MALPTRSRLSRRLTALLCSAATLGALPALAQVEITDDRTDPVNTSTVDGGQPADVTITDSGSVTVNTEGPAVILDSSNDLRNDGTIRADNVDNATGVELQGGTDRNFTNAGLISVAEDFDQDDTDDDPFNDTPFASGEGRTGILVSGASPFQGNITLEEASTILVEGNQSYGINLANTPVGAGLDGTLENRGAITVRGDDSAGVRVASGVTGDVRNTGAVSVTGVGSSAFDLQGDIDGGFFSSGQISNSGYRFNQRLNFNPNLDFDRLDLGAEDLGQAAPAIRVGGDVGGGIELGITTATVEDADGNETEVTASISTINHFGSAPAILIDGDGVPIAVGRVSPVTDPAADGFDADRTYAFIHEGTLSANGLYNDFDATVLSVADATLDGGIRNTGSLTSTTFIGARPLDVEGVEAGTGLSRVIVLGDNAIAERIDNTGLIIAQASEAADEVFADDADIPEPRFIEAVAIDIAATASVESLENDGAISAVLVGRDGSATVIRDASGTLSDIVNRGNISALASSSDADGQIETDFTLIALDLSNNTTGVTFLQERREDPDPDDDVTPTDPLLAGSIRLGSGDDSVSSTAGTILGDIDFGAGDDVLALNDTGYAGTITNEDGLVITAENGATLGLAGSEPIDITSASFDGTSNFRPTIDGDTGTATALQATGAISFASGATINPILTNLINTDTVGNPDGTAFTLASASDLSIGDLAALNSADDGSFLFDTSYAQVGDTLVVTVDLREASELGLDPTQTGVASSVFNATLQALQSNSELGNAIANLDTAGEFNAAYNQLLPEFAAASRQFVVANTDGAVGAVSNHLDAARRSPDKPGGAWLQEFAYFADRELAGLSEQYRGEGFGFAGGLDTALGPFHAVGVNFGFASTEIEDVVGVDEPLDVTTLIAGLYAGFASGNLGIDAYLGGGLNEFEQNRRIAVGDFRGNSFADWNGTHINASLRAGYDVSFGERFWARPVISLDYLRLSEDAYEEAGDLGIALAVDERTSEIGAVSGLLNFGATFNGKRTWIRPSIRVGYRNEFLSDPVLTSFGFVDIPDALAAETLSADFPTSGILLGFSVAAGSGFSSVGFDFDSDIRDGFIRHTGRIVVRLLF